MSMTKTEQQERIIVEMKRCLSWIARGSGDEGARMCLAKVDAIRAEPVMQEVDQYGELKRRLKSDIPWTPLGWHEVAAIIAEVDGMEPAPTVEQGYKEIECDHDINVIVADIHTRLAKLEQATGGELGELLRAICRQVENHNQSMGEIDTDMADVWHSQSMQLGALLAAYEAKAGK